MQGLVQSQPSIAHWTSHRHSRAKRQVSCVTRPATLTFQSPHRAGLACTLLPVSPTARQVQCTAIAERKSFTSFDAMLTDTDTPVLVDFYATWCGPCQMMSGIISNVAQGFTDDLQVVKIDTDKYPQLASRFRIQGLPTLLLFRNGKVIDRIEGVLDQRALGNRLRYYLRGLDAKFGRAQG